MIAFRSTIAARTVAFTLVVLFLATGCGNIGRQIDNASMDNLEQQAEPSDAAIRELFVESGLGEGDEFLEELNRIERDRVIAIVREVREKGIRDGDPDFGQKYADEKLRLKAVYFLWVLDSDRKQNEETLLKSARSDDKIIRREAILHLAAIAEKGAFEHLPLIFAESSAADGQFADDLGFFFAGVLENSTEPFLRALAKEPDRNRKAVCRLTAVAPQMNGDEWRAEVRTNVEPLTNSPDLKPIASEMLACLAVAK